MNNSGRAQRGMIANTELKVDQELFDLNVMGTISMTKAVLPHMIEQNTGHIVVVSSVAGKFGKVLATNVFTHIFMVRRSSGSNASFIGHTVFTAKNSNLKQQRLPSKSI